MGVEVKFCWSNSCDPTTISTKKVELAFDALMSLEENNDLANFMKATPAVDDSAHSELPDHKKPGMKKFSHCVSKTFDFCFLF